MSIEQRLGSGSRVLLIPEADGWDTDPGSPAPVVLPLRDQMGFGASDSLIDAPVFLGNRLPDGVVSGMINAQGSLPLALEFVTVGHILKAFVGDAGYTKETLPGSNYLHRFIIHPTSCAAPGSFQLQSEFCGTAKVYLRDKGIRVNSIQIPFATEGQATLDVDLIGSGSQATTDLGGTVEDNGYSPASFFNGEMTFDNVKLDGLTNFSLQMSNNMQRQDAAFRGGTAAGVNAGKLTLGGSLELLFGDGGAQIESDLNWYLKAVQQVLFALDCAWSNLPPASATRFLRVVMPENRAQRNAPRPGGAAGITVSQEFKTVNQSPAAFPAQTWSTPNPTIGAGNLVVKVDGGADQTFVFAGGESLTAAAALINATATGFRARNFMGRLLLSTLVGGSTKTVQVTASSTVTGLSFDNTVHSGLSNAPVVIELVNQRSTDY